MHMVIGMINKATYTVHRTAIIRQATPVTLLAGSQLKLWFPRSSQ
jgi:hypothetical protein